MTAGVTELRRRLKETSDGGRKLRALGELLAPYRWRVLLMCLSLLAATAAALAPAPLAKEAINQGIDQHNVTALYVIAGIFLVSAVVYALATWAQTYLVGWVGQRALQDLRMKLFAHLQSLSVGFYSRNIAGVVISRMTNDVEALDQLVEDGLATLIQSSLMLIGVIVILMVMDLQLALLTFIALPLLFGGALWFRIASAGAYRATREKIAAITGYLAESLSGIRAVRSFGQEQRHIDRFAELNEENRSANMRTIYLNAAYFPAVELLSALITVEILVVGGLAAIDGHASTGVVFAFIAALNNFFDPLQQLSQLYTTYQSGMAALDKILRLLDEQPEIVDAPDAITLPQIAGRIEFRDVSFQYGSGDDAAWALRDVDLVVPPGRRSRWSARPAPASRRSPSSSPVSMTRPRGRCWSMATTCARSPPSRCAHRWGSSRRRRSCSAARSGRTSRSARPKRATSRSVTPRARSAPTSSSTRSSRATTRRSASAVFSCRPDSASCWRSPGRWPPTRGSWCSTRRPRTSTCTPRR